MARIRTIKPEFWHDEELAALPAETRLLAIGLLNHADDEGYFRAHAMLVKAAIFPFMEAYGNITVMLRELSKVGYLRLFDGPDGKKYGHVSNFQKHQTINKPRASKIKELDELREKDGSPTVALPCGKEQGKEQGKERNNKPRACFDDWYSIYPNKVGRGQAEKAFAKISPDPDLLAKMISAVGMQKADRERKKRLGEFVPEWKHPSTWLNGKCWEDEIAEAPKAKRRPPTDLYLPTGKLNPKYEGCGYE